MTSATLTSVKIEGKGGNGEGSKGVWMESTGTMMISGGSISKVEKGVYATGAGRLVMTGVQISKVKMGVEATNGMLVIKGNSTITFNNGSGNYGVRVKNGVTMATLTSVTIAGTGSGEGSKGVIVGSEDVGATGTKMIMEEVRISNVAMGVEVTKGILAMKGGSIGFMGEYGVSLTKSTAALMGITIKGNNQGKEGVKLNGGMVDLYKTNIREVQKGMSVENGVVRMFEGEIGFMGNYGIGLSKSTAALKNVRITGPSNKGTGVIMQNGVGAVMMKEVNISKVGTGVEVMGGILAMKGGSIGFIGEYGVSLTKSTAALIGVKIEGNRTGKEGIKLNGGIIDLFRTNIRDVHKGMTITEGIVRMFGGEIGFKGNYGVYLDKGGAALKNVRMTYTGNNKTADFIKVRGGTVIAEDIIITSTTDNGQGVSVTNGGRVWLVGTDLKGVHKGVTITEGSVRMEGGEINFKGEYGVYFTRHKYNIT
ncbi:hypothetical protein BBbe_10230 [Bartonella bovis 91-4]|uniref:Right handed beta helix domain-containing protein n=1 Tax=Bartonella bovis 91-4 TaxID=1094491 RepID=N6ULL7_9HYPH|nr:hypothetical protein BBbe_10230 [Bartonella bovis 91-4]